MLLLRQLLLLLRLRLLGDLRCRGLLCELRVLLRDGLRRRVGHGRRDDGLQVLRHRRGLRNRDAWGGGQ